jgi:hypothetical protein
VVLDSKLQLADVMDAKSDAPGTDIDASGMPWWNCQNYESREFPFTLIFVAVVGEEQGLYGAKQSCWSCQRGKWNLIAMLNNDMIGNSLSSGTLLRDNAECCVFLAKLFHLSRNRNRNKNAKINNRDNDGHQDS